MKTAAEIIAMIEKLPPTEREQVRRFLQTALHQQPTDAVRRMEFSKAAQISEAMFDRHAKLFHKLSQ